MAEEVLFVDFLKEKKAVSFQVVNSFSAEKFDLNRITDYIYIYHIYMRFMLFLFSLI